MAVLYGRLSEEEHPNAHQTANYKLAVCRFVFSSTRTLTDIQKFWISECLHTILERDQRCRLSSTECHLFSRFWFVRDWQLSCHLTYATKYTTIIHLCFRHWFTIENESRKKSWKERRKNYKILFFMFWDYTTICFHMSFLLGLQKQRHQYRSSLKKILLWCRNIVAIGVSTIQS